MRLSTLAASVPSSMAVMFGPPILAMAKLQMSVWEAMAADGRGRRPERISPGSVRQRRHAARAAGLDHGDDRATPGGELVRVVARVGAALSGEREAAHVAAQAARQVVVVP